MLRHTTFAIVSLFACSVASAQQPYSPYLNYGGVGSNPAVNCPSGRCGTGNCATGNCASGQCGNGQMICGPNGCYDPGTVNPYQSRLPLGSGYRQPRRVWPFSAPLNSNYGRQPAYSVPSSTYPGFPNIPSAYRNRPLRPVSGFPLFGAPASGNWNHYPTVSGASNQYGAYGGPGILH